MRITVTMFGRVLDLTLDPTPDDTTELDDDEDDPPPSGTVSVDLTHQGGAAVGFTADLGSYPAE